MNQPERRDEGRISRTKPWKKVLWKKEKVGSYDGGKEGLLRGKAMKKNRYYRPAAPQLSLR